MRILNQLYSAVCLIVHLATGLGLVSKRVCNTRQTGNISPLYSKIALTREDGANNKLANLLNGYEIYEIPCIMFAEGPDAAQLTEAIRSHDVIVITSPQAAKVFLQSWQLAGRPTDLRIATVGEGSSKVLVAEGLIPFFEPSDFTAKTLALELPFAYGITVLYPSSALAENTLANGLESRGFVVTRLNTYTTLPAEWSEEKLTLARTMDIVTFASPSAVKTWSEKVGTQSTAVVIGPSSAKAALSHGFRKVVSTEGSKGVAAWADLIKTTAAAF